MKKNIKTWTLFVLQMIFMLIVPCVVIWVQYGDLTQRYKISVTAIMLLLLVFYVVKKIILNKYINGLNQKIINIETNALSITDKKSIEANKKVWRLYSIMQLFISVIVPFLLFILAIITIKVVENGLIKLYGCLMFCLMSISVGIMFRLGEIFATKLMHEGDE